MMLAAVVRRLDANLVRAALVHSMALALSCLLSYCVVTQLLAHAPVLSVSDDLLGGMWAVVATVFVYGESSQHSVTAALARMAATSVSCILCLVYLLIFPFAPWGMAVLIGIGAFALTLTGRSDLIVTTSITTAVVMVVAALSPHDAWVQPILRVLDTLVGVAVGVTAAWISQHVVSTQALATASGARRSRPTPVSRPR